jgi:hypothetical protein
MNKTTCIAECDSLGNSLKHVHIYNYIYTTSTVINYALRSFSAKHKYFPKLFNSFTFLTDNTVTSLYTDGFLQ